LICGLPYFGLPVAESVEISPHQTVAATAIRSMIFRRFIQILGHASQLAGAILLLVILSHVSRTFQQPWLGDLLVNKPLLVWGAIGSLFLFGFCTRPPTRYEYMDPGMRAALNHTPLSRLVGRSTGLLFLEIVAILAVMIVGGVCLVYSILDMFNLPSGAGFKKSTMWCFVCGEILFLGGMNILRSYIYPGS